MNIAWRFIALTFILSSVISPSRGISFAQRYSIPNTELSSEFGDEFTEIDDEKSPGEASDDSSIKASHFYLSMSDTGLFASALVLDLKPEYTLQSWMIGGLVAGNVQQEKEDVVGDGGKYEVKDFQWGRFGKRFGYQVDSTMTIEGESMDSRTIFVGAKDQIIILSILYSADDSAQTSELRSMTDSLKLGDEEWKSKTKGDVKSLLPD